MEKRISSRAIIFDGDQMYTMFRRKVKDNGQVKEYYVIPGGGLEEGETLEENVIREIKEEFSLDIKVLKLLDTIEDEKSIENLFLCKVVGGTPKIAGPEAERISETNYYEIRKVNVKDIDSIDISNKDIIKKAYELQNN